MNKNTVVVTRHKSLVTYLAELNMISENVQVIEHATKDDIEGKHVIGVLPNYLACYADYVTEIPLTLPPELRGKELSLEQIKQYAGEPATYVIRKY